MSPSTHPAIAELNHDAQEALEDSSEFVLSDVSSSTASNLTGPGRTVDASSLGRMLDGAIGNVLQRWHRKRLQQAFLDQLVRTRHGFFLLDQKTRRMSQSPLHPGLFTFRRHFVAFPSRKIFFPHNGSRVVVGSWTAGMDARFITHIICMDQEPALHENTWCQSWSFQSLPPDSEAEARLHLMLFLHTALQEGGIVYLHCSDADARLRGSETIAAYLMFLRHEHKRKKSPSSSLIEVEP
ncbi:hypothetical protein OE88DRAFT_1735647 [Heliocybe sulcata]|uniref:Uncharacterized protein n=1 Tax=Heliocybe sulcata TaxID=5364 RepID=A0A5C3MZZ7_9AGAM|nr:hypothetical protein OE88DRAFT_1735647 [Heliocybe sulcata]